MKLTELPSGPEPDTMTTPDHSGVRPLSPYGEGYCRWCFFVVGLGPGSLLDQHFRGMKECPGSGTRPPEVTPYASRKAAFRVKAADAWCPGCGQKVPVTCRAGERVYGLHYRPPGFRVCLYWQQPVGKKD